MTAPAEIALALAVGIPFVGAGAGLLLGARGRPWAPLATAVATFLACAGVLPGLGSGAPELVLGTLLPGLPLRLRPDALGVIFALLASSLWIPTTIYSAGYLGALREHARTRYDACFAVVVGAAIGVAMAADLLTLFVFYEILTVATWPLVVHKETPEAFAAGRKYLVYTLGGGAAVLVGLALLAATAGPGALVFEGGGNGPVAGLSPGIARTAFVLLFLGFGVKAAIMPLHGWLPSAMVAPTPVSGLLHAVAVVKAGVFGLLRLLHHLYGPDLVEGLGLSDPVVALAAATVIGGSILALAQDDFKAMLAYSTVSQLSMIVLGAALLTREGVLGAAYGLAAHGFAKLAMFFVAGAVFVKTGRTRISELGGLGRRMPLAFALFGLAALSMAGLPPLAGFGEKWLLGAGAWRAGRGWVLAVLVASTVLNLAYFLPVLLKAWFGSPPEGASAQGLRDPAGRAGPSLLAPAAAAVAGALLLGIFTSVPHGPFESARLAASQVFGPATLDLPAMSTGRAIPPFAVLLLGGGLALLLPGALRTSGLLAAGAGTLLLAWGMPAGDSWGLPFLGGEVLLLHADPLSRLAGVIFSLVTLLALAYASAFARRRTILCALLYASAALAAVYAGDWISLVIAWELMAVASTVLVAEHGGDAAPAAVRYLLWHGFGGALLMAGAALCWVQSGSPILGPAPSTTAAVLLFLGAGVNAAFIPLHAWLPDTYPRPHFAASVFLSVYTTKSAVYLLARTMPAEGVPWVAWMGGAMALYGVTFAVMQNDVRRLLSYHIVSQVGYMVAGVGLAGALGTDGGMAHVFNHILYKALLFMCAGAVLWRTGAGTLDRLGGLARRMPLTAAAYAVAALSISGVPLFNGYVSKGMVTAAAHGQSTLLWLVLEAASFGTFLSFLKIGWFAFLRPGDVEASDPPPAASAAMLATAGLCVLIGVAPSTLYGLLPSGGAGHVAYAAGPLLESLVVLGAAGGFFLVAGRRLLAPHEPRLRDVDALHGPAGRAAAAGCAALAGAFRKSWRGVLGGVEGTRAAGRAALLMEARDAGWNMAAYGAALLVLVLLVLGGVQG